jgi:hypothetical protein
MQHTVEVDIQVQTMKHYLFDSCLRSKFLRYWSKSLKNKACKPYLSGYLVALISLASVTTSAMADCNTVRPLKAEEFSPASGQALLSQMVAVCSSGAPERWATLVTSNVKTLLAKIPDARRKTLYAEYCSYTRQAVDALAGQTSTGVHTLSIDTYHTECGQKMSTWYVHSAAGKLALRLEVAKEGGLMKINTH